MNRKRKIERKGVANRCLTALLTLFMLLLSAPGNAQCEAVNKAFQAGEFIEYDLYFNWKFIWIKAGKASLGIEEKTVDGKKGYQMNLLSASKKSIDFFFRMRDTLTCVLGERLQPVYFRKGAEEGKRYTVDEAWFSYKDGVSYVDQCRTFRDGRTIRTQYNDSRCIYDMLSILAQARSFDPSDYKEGQKIAFPMTTGKRVEEQTLIFRGREVIEANDEKDYNCLVFSFVEYDKKNREKEVITFFITDDDNHLPVRLDMYLNIGSAKAFLTNVKNNRHPITSIVKEHDKKKKRRSKDD